MKAIEIARCCKDMRLKVKIVYGVYDNRVAVRCRSCGMEGVSVILSHEQMKTWRRDCNKHVTEALWNWDKTVKPKEAICNT